MKQKDIALIAVIAIVSGIVSFLVSGWIFAKPADRQQKAEIVDIITSDFSLPDSKYFNAKAIDPTQLIQIGDTKNPNPFGQ
jgi:hypothetical protein